MAEINFSSGLWVDTDFDAINDRAALSVFVDLSAGTYTAYSDFNRILDGTSGTTGATDARGTNGNDYMVATLSRDFAFFGSFLYGLDGADQLFGSERQDILEGGTGADVMSGGGGDDVYYVDRTEDQVIELAGGGLADIVVSTTINVDLNLYANVEGGTLYTNATPLTVTGTAQANFLSVWQNGAADTAIGGNGNDTYVVNSGDVVVEAAGTAAGSADLVYSSLFTIDLSSGFYDNVENADVIGTANLHLTGSNVGNRLQGNTGNNEIDGRAGNDILSGDKGNDKLYGGTGADTMTGGDGNDTYSVDVGADLVIETSFSVATGGYDYVYSSVSLVMSENVEVLVLTGAAALNGYGTDQANYLYGSSGANVLRAFGHNDRVNGAAGNDIIYGGLGNDKLAGGADRDTFVFDTALSGSANLDVITDFVAADDAIYLDNAIFTQLTATGPLAASRFWASATGTAHDADDRIVYNTTNGALYYDSNGNAAGGATAFAILASKPTITAADFVVI